MRAIETTVLVDDDGAARRRESPGLTPGEHRALLVVEERVNSSAERPPLDFSVRSYGAWPKDLSLRREDMYDEWGR